MSWLSCNMDVILCIVVVVPGPITTVLGPRHHVTSPADTVLRQQHTHTHSSSVLFYSTVCDPVMRLSLYSVCGFVCPYSFVVCLTHTIYVNTLTSLQPCFFLPLFCFACVPLMFIKPFWACFFLPFFLFYIHTPG